MSEDEKKFLMCAACYVCILVGITLVSKAHQSIEKPDHQVKERKVYKHEHTHKKHHH